MIDSILYEDVKPALVRERIINKITVHKSTLEKSASNSFFMPFNVISPLPLFYYVV
jgi:hypothetical protein